MTTFPSTLRVHWRERELMIAAFEAMKMFSDARYADFLQHSPPGRLDNQWFEWFVGSWTVARTVAKEKRDEVRRYLDTEFRPIAVADRDGTAVDEAAAIISRRGWGARELRSGNSTAPVSLVSKIAFFLNPDMFIPYDSSALLGLNSLRGIRKQDGQGRLYSPSYREYLAAFEAVFKASDSQISALFEEPWMLAVSKHMGLSDKSMSRRGLRRKIVDNLLMQRGGRQFTPDG